VRKGLDKTSEGKAWAWLSSRTRKAEYISEVTYSRYSYWILLTQYN